MFDISSQNLDINSVCPGMAFLATGQPCIESLKPEFFRKKESQRVGGLTEEWREGGGLGV
jgi:hypothetical protein